MELKDQLKQQIDMERLPQHIAIIMDGNGRWAKERGKQRLFGHQSAIQSVREVSEASAELGVATPSPPKTGTAPSPKCRD